MASTDQGRTEIREAAPRPTTPEDEDRGDASKGASRSPVKPAVKETSTGTKVPSGAKTAAATGEDEPRTVRRVRLTLSAVDPFSVMKLSFLIAIAVGIATVVAVILLWNIVNSMGIWASIDSLGRDLTGGEPLPFMEFLTFSKFASYGTVVAAVNVVIITALGTLLAFLYNIVAAMLGGLAMTFTDD